MEQEEELQQKVYRFHGTNDGVRPPTGIFVAGSIPIVQLRYQTEEYVPMMLLYGFGARSRSARALLKSNGQHIIPSTIAVFLPFLPFTGGKERANYSSTVTSLIKLLGCLHPCI
jgi:hypothetical protein